MSVRACWFGSKVLFLYEMNWFIDTVDGDIDGWAPGMVIFDGLREEAEAGALRGVNGSRFFINWANHFLVLGSSFKHSLNVESFN